MTPEVERGLLDTSVFIGSESGRRLTAALLPRLSAISVVTLAELRAGVLVARDAETRDLRLRTLDATDRFEMLAIDETVAAHWAAMRVRLAELGRRTPVNDLWIAATAVAHGIPVVTQDHDFDAVEGMGGLEVVRV